MEIMIEDKKLIIRKICIMGLGYIGLPTAALLANRGFDVTGVDIKQDAIDIINKGQIHIVEPDLDTFVKAGVDSRRLKAKLEPEKADVFFICVPTPFEKNSSNYEPDMSFVEDAAKKIAPYIMKDNIVILESTSPVGSTEMIELVLKEYGVDTNSIYIAYCPERVLPGKIMIELVENDRIVGGLNQTSTEVVSAFYKDFIIGKVLETDCRTAEMAKLVENASRDSQIAFANELSMICDKLNINVWELIELANRHPRVNILNPGTGVGGHCIAVDPWFIVSKSPEEAKIIRKAREINNYKTDWVIDKIKKVAENHELTKPKIACMGISFKPDIDDLRESPALSVADTLKKESYDIYVCEPNVKDNTDYKFLEIDESISKCDIIVFLVAHSKFANLNLQEDKVVLDFCGVFK